MHKRLAGTHSGRGDACGCDRRTCLILLGFKEASQEVSGRVRRKERQRHQYGKRKRRGSP
eukprot:2146177-Pleurochrysis_carterae.AAC.2